MPRVNVDLDLACLIYTSGSTGDPKAVMSDHSNVVFACTAITTYLGSVEDDVVLSEGGAKVLIDTVSLQYMGGAEIDYVDDLMGQSFQIRNPNAVASCGCGTSFSI